MGSQRAPLAASGFQLPQSLGDAVVERRLSVGANGQHRRGQHFRIARKRMRRGQLDRHRVVEIDGEQLVVFVDRRQQCRHRSQQRRRLRAHALAAIDDQAERDAALAVVERRRRPKASVFVDLEIVLGQPGDMPAAGIGHDGGYDDQLGMNSDDGLKEKQQRRKE